MAEIRNGLVVVRTGDEESLLLLAAGEVPASYESLGVGTSCTYAAGDLTGVAQVGFAGRKPGGFLELNHEQGEEQPYFLDSCSMCKMPLGTNLDIFMYRGNVPFCSEECRQDQIDTDEMKDRKWSNLTAKAMLSAVKKPNVSVRRAAAGTVVAG